METRLKRRPRTVIYSTSNIDGVKIADQILYCSDQKVLFKDFKEVENLFSAGARRGTIAIDENVMQSTVVTDGKPSARGEHAMQEAAVASPVAPMTTTTTMTRTYTVSTTVSHAPVAPVASQSRFCCEPCVADLDSQQDLINPENAIIAVDVQPPLNG